jgi:hypothetical protein
MRLQFELDPAIIHHIIYSQAGSIGKAVIELIMNSVDASAKTVVLSMSREGFTCKDDGEGFATREDVLRYFGRFGTPHQEGDATYGRFRLGKGQIMAHASTVWKSRDWMMVVDTRETGYSYDLENLEVGQRVSGCDVTGIWYEPLSDTELSSAVQEIRDLVRYTPVSVELNGRVITRDPLAEKWDFEDEYAWYRAKVEGAVSIYNQGVLVRRDPAQTWGAGGLIVSKKAIALNVSRTEILRKTCPVWKPIAAQFAKMAREISAQLGEHRKTEARREKAAHDLLAGDADMLNIFGKEEVITLLPGKRHMSMYNFLELNGRMHGGKVSVAENNFDIPKGEGIAREKISQVIHPSTLARFNCHTSDDLRDAIERILEALGAAATDREAMDQARTWRLDRIKVPEFIDFKTLSDAYIEHTSIVSEVATLDRETRRAWTALRWCIKQYAGLCSGGERSRRSNRVFWEERQRKHILLGESNAYEAWTDGETYIAFNIDIVKRLKSDPIKTAAYLFGLTEHEVSHDGDSIDCGHDEAFYQRYHDISIRMAPERQHYLHIFITKCMQSMEGEGRSKHDAIWRETYLLERASNGRQKRDLPPVIEDLSAHPLVKQEAAPEDRDFIDAINAALVESGACPPPPNWVEVRKLAREAQERRAQLWAAERNELETHDRERWEWASTYERDEKARIVDVLQTAVEDIDPPAWSWLWGSDDETLRVLWADKPWEREVDPHLDLVPTEANLPDNVPSSEELEADMQAYTEERDNPLARLDAKHKRFLIPGETWWSLERNAAVAGFFRVEDYLTWRAEEATPAAEDRSA